MKFCSECGHPTTISIPEGDNRSRHTCPSCHTIHYQNPKIIVGTLPIAPDGRILLLRRNIAPRKNFWTLPAGFMENQESALAGALRETDEESKIDPPKNPELFSVISVPAIDQVHLFYKVDLINFNFSTTPESNAAELFYTDQLPWETLAFATVERTLRHYISCLDTSFSLLNDEIHPKNTTSTT